MAVRADRWLRDRFPGLSGAQAEEAFSEGWVRSISGARVRKGDRVESLEVRTLEDRLARLRSGAAGLEVPILHHGDGWVLVDKPAGLDGHPLKLKDDRTLTHWAFAQFPQTHSEFPGIQPTLVPHRLDRGTSGLQIVALSTRAFSGWRARFRAHQVAKRYWAWVVGAPEWETFRAVWPLAHDPSDRSKMVRVGGGVRFRPPVLEAETEFRVLARKEGRALLQADSRTGVTHQVRAHAAAAGFPLVGDSLYGGTVGDWPMLRAVRLETVDGAWDAPAVQGFGL